MSYPHFQISLPLLSTAGDPTITANSTGDKGSVGVGPNSYIVRRVAVQQTTTAAWSAAAVFGFREACGAASSATGNEFATLTVAASALVKSGLYYRDVTPRKIRPGNRIVVNVKTASTGELFRAWAVVEPHWEKPSNFATGKYISVSA